LEIEKSGLVFPVLEAHCDYLFPARYDDLLGIYGWVGWVKGSRFQIDYEIKNENQILVTGSTIHNTNTTEGKSRRVPEYIKTLILE